MVQELMAGGDLYRALNDPAQAESLRWQNRWGSSFVRHSQGAMTYSLPASPVDVACSRIPATLQ